jgi:hypothetical protein
VVCPHACGTCGVSDECKICERSIAVKDGVPVIQKPSRLEDWGYTDALYFSYTV